MSKPQSQESFYDQIKALIPIANREGLYDAADYLQEKVNEIDRRLAAHDKDQRREAQEFAIESAILAGHQTFAKICHAVSAEDDRETDRALQRMRKNSKIVYNKEKRRWEIKKPGV